MRSSDRQRQTEITGPSETERETVVHHTSQHMQRLNIDSVQRRSRESGDFVDINKCSHLHNKDLLDF